MLYDVINYGVDPESDINYDEIEALAAKEKPKLITVGASAYPRTIDFERMGISPRPMDLSARGYCTYSLVGCLRSSPITRPSC